jgi:hypothetical protein
LLNRPYAEIYFALFCVQTNSAGTFYSGKCLAQPDSCFGPAQPNPFETLTLGFLYKYGSLSLALGCFALPPLFFSQPPLSLPVFSYAQQQAPLFYTAAHRELSSSPSSPRPAMALGTLVAGTAPFLPPFFYPWRAGAFPSQGRRLPSPSIAMAELPWSRRSPAMARRPTLLHGRHSSSTPPHGAGVSPAAPSAPSCMDELHLCSSRAPPQPWHPLPFSSHGREPHFPCRRAATSASRGQRLPSPSSASPSRREWLAPRKSPSRATSPSQRPPQVQASLSHACLQQGAPSPEPSHTPQPRQATTVYSLRCRACAVFDKMPKPQQQRRTPRCVAPARSGHSPSICAAPARRRQNPW